MKGFSSSWLGRWVAWRGQVFEWEFGRFGSESVGSAIRSNPLVSISLGKYGKRVQAVLSRKIREDAASC